MRIRRGVTLFAMSLLIIAGVFALSRAMNGDEVFCELDGPIATDPSPEWHWIRDGGNDCQWTLFDSEGNRAPDSMYEDLGLTPPG